MIDAKQQDNVDNTDNQGYLPKIPTCRDFLFGSFGNLAVSGRPFGFASPSRDGFARSMC